MDDIGILLDYGGTLVEELGYDERAANEWLLGFATIRPDKVTIDDVMAKLEELSSELMARTDQADVEVTWLTLTRLAYGALGIRFASPLVDLELGYWKAAATTRPLPEARRALEILHQRGIRMAVVSNCRFNRHVIRYELGRYDLSKHIAFVIVSAEYAVRKPNPMIFNAAAGRLGLPPERIWHIGDALATDVAGAKAAGMNALWLRPNGAEGGALPGADHVASSWGEIVRFFESKALRANFD